MTLSNCYTCYTRNLDNTSCGQFECAQKPHWVSTETSEANGKKVRVENWEKEKPLKHSFRLTMQAQTFFFLILLCTSPGYRTWRHSRVNYPRFQPLQSLTCRATCILYICYFLKSRETLSVKSHSFLFNSPHFALWLWGRNTSVIMPYCNGFSLFLRDSWPWQITETKFCKWWSAYRLRY